MTVASLDEYRARVSQRPQCVPSTREQRAAAHRQAEALQSERVRAVQRIRQDLERYPEVGLVAVLQVLIGGLTTEEADQRLGLTRH